MSNNFKCLMLNDELKNSKFKIQNSKLSQSGFTMVELIFVIVVIGILANVGSSYIPDNRLSNDTKFLILKIKEKQKNAIGYSVQNFGDKPWSTEDNSTCIDLNTTKLEKEDLKSQKPHKFNSKLNVDGDTTLCFDSYGRPYQSEQLLLKSLDMNLTYRKNEYKSISVAPMSGYVIINK